MSPASEPEVAAAPQSYAIVRALLIVAALGGALWIVHRLNRIVVVLILAMFVAYVIAPLVDLAQSPMSLRGRSRRLPRGAAVALVYVFFIAGIGAGAALLWPSAAEQLDEVIAAGPAYIEKFRAWEGGWTRYYERLRIPLEVRHSLDQTALGAGDAVFAYARGALGTVFGALADLPWLVLVPLLAFLLLKDAARLRRTVLTALPKRIQLRGHQLFEELNRTLAAYVRAQLIACAIVGTLCGLGFALLGVPYAILLGILAALLEFVPLVGPLVVAAVAVLAAALHDPLLAIWTAIFLMVLRMVQDYVIYPRLIGRDVHLHPLAVILAVLAGVELGGIAGVFVAVPVVALIVVVARHWLAWREPDADLRIPPLLSDDHDVDWTPAGASRPHVQS